MKKYLDLVPVSSLVLSIILTFIFPEKTAYQVSLVVSATIFSYQQWLFKQEAPNYQKKIEEIQKAISSTQEELYKLDEHHKKELAQELSQIKDDIGKMSISLTKVPGVAAPREKARVQF